jgi:hypothetical protein
MILLLTVLAMGATLATDAQAQRRRGPVVVRHTSPSPFELVFEGGAVLPLGDLGDDFIGTEKGLGASTGYELGARLRYYLGPTTTVGPAFHYARFGQWDGLSQDGTPYHIKTSTYRWGLDIQQFLTPRRTVVRPYLTLGVALCTNRYEDWAQDMGTYLNSTNDLAFGAGGGLAMGPVELSVVYTYCEAEKRALAQAGDLADATYDWSYISVRAGLAF